MSGTAAKERPILYSTPMILALLNGSKTQTRRVCKPACDEALGPAEAVCRCDDETFIAWWGATPLEGWEFATKHGYPDGGGFVCPYGKPGDRLWVKESCWLRPERTTRMMREGADTWPPVMYAADMDDADRDFCKQNLWLRRNSIHCPRWASRITLEVTDVRVERVQSISLDDIWEEGTQIPVNKDGHLLAILTGKHKPSDYWPCATYDELKSRDDFADQWARSHFAMLWDGINSKTHPWESNPWVWAIAFRRVEDGR